MRIVAGSWRGRTIDAPKGRNTRPTSDRVREALFSSLTSHFGSWDQVIVMDAYAGSGALGLEALSRGAAFATFAECDKQALAILKKNISSLGAQDQTAVYGGSASSMIGHFRLRAPVSLLLLDPPYRINKSEVRGLIDGFAEAKQLAADSVIVWEHGSKDEVEWPTGVDPIDTKRYGSTELDIGIMRMPEEGR